MKLVLDIKNENKARKLIEFLKDIPSEFKKPLKVKKYIHICRDEIHEDRFR